MPKPIHKLNEIRVLLNSGQISYKEAQEMAKPHLEAMNDAMARVARDYGKKHHPVTFVGFMR